MRRIITLLFLVFFTSTLCFSVQETKKGIIHAVESHANQGAWADYFTFELHYFTGTSWLSKKLYVYTGHANSKYTITTILLAHQMHQEVEITWENNSNEMVQEYYALKKVKLDRK